MSKKSIRITGAFSLIVVLLLWLTLTGFNENMQYYVTIHDVTAGLAEESIEGLRIKGNLVPGSLEREVNSLNVKFVIAESGEEMTVHYAKELPDTFKDGAEVLVEGTYHPAGYFDAEVLMAKCPSKYESADQYNTQATDKSDSPRVNDTYLREGS